jgi:hypothetical protein
MRSCVVRTRDSSLVRLVKKTMVVTDGTRIRDRKLKNNFLVVVLNAALRLIVSRSWSFWSTLEFIIFDLLSNSKILLLTKVSKDLSQCHSTTGAPSLCKAFKSSRRHGIKESLLQLVLVELRFITWEPFNISIYLMQAIIKRLNQDLWRFMRRSELQYKLMLQSSAVECEAMKLWMQSSNPAMFSCGFASAMIMSQMVWSSDEIVQGNTRKRDEPRWALCVTTCSTFVF